MNDRELTENGTGEISTDKGKKTKDTAVVSKAKARRDKRAAAASKALFRAIDVLFKPSQNSCPYIKGKIADTIDCENDVVYDDSLADVCLMDVYSVPSENKQPAFILIHGGGFSAGDKKYRKGQSQFFAINGFKVFCVDYGLSPDFVFPNPIKHLVTAANYIYDNAERFNIDKNKILIGGDSAGAYYASMLCAFDGNDIFKDTFGVELKFKPCGALLNCGLYDIDTVFNTKYFLDLDDGVFLSFTGIRRRDFSSYEYKDVCMPINYISGKFPPAFVIYSPHDMFCKGQGEALIDKLDNAGVYYEHYAARHSTSNHCFSLSWHGWDACVANELMMSFAKRLVNDKIKL